MFKKAAGLLGIIASVAVAAPAQAQSFVAFSANNDGAEFWDNQSTDGEKCNIGYVLTGVAGTTGNDCINQRPTGWLPYTGTAASSFWSAPNFVITGGTLEVNVGAGIGGDVAGLDRNWGFWQSVNPDYSSKTFTNLNTVGSFPAFYSFGAGEKWGFWVEVGSTIYTSDVDSQFALFNISGSEYAIGIEDTPLPGGDKDYQDMIASVKFTGSVPEPSSLALLAVGSMAAVGAVRRRRA